LRVRPRVHAATRPSLPPLSFRGWKEMQSSDEIRRENENPCPSAVIAVHVH